MCFEFQMDELLKKDGDISKEIVDLIDLYNGEKYNYKLSSNIQHKIMNKLTNVTQEEVWDRVLSSLSSSEISGEIIEFLIKNKICLQTLCHMDLSDKWLLKLIDYDDAPLYTVAKRYFLSDRYSSYEFAKFYCKYLCKYDYISIHLLELYKNSPKRELLIYLCFNNGSFSEKETLNHQKLSTQIKMMTNTEEISSVYGMYSEVGDVLLSIANNYFTPKEILEELCSIKHVKYASKIRMLSKDNLKIKEIQFEGNTGDG